MKIDTIGIYMVTLAFEVNSNLDLDENNYFLEIDFLWIDIQFKIDIHQIVV